MVPPTIDSATFSFPTTIRFGSGLLRTIVAELESLQASRPLVVTDPGLLATRAFGVLQETLGEKAAIFSGVHPNPLEGDVEEAARAYCQAECDSVIAFGGGSALDVGKAVRLRLRRPERTLRDFDFTLEWNHLASFIAIPTTAGTGSEVGRSAVIIVDERKKVFFHPALLADRVLLDPEATRDLPSRLTAATGADALTHCIESFTSPTFQPFCDGIALEGMRLIRDALPRAVRNGNDLDARGKMQVAAAMGGVAFQKDLGATHSLAHPLSSICGLHHGLANALCLPHVMEWNAQRKHGLYERVGTAFGLRETSDASVIEAVRGLLSEIGLAGSLSAHGVNRTHLDALVAQAIEDSCHRTNPVPLAIDDFRILYERAL